MYSYHVIIDLEMNPVHKKHKEARSAMHTEVIEIGAVKLDSSFQVVDRFSRLVKPQYSDFIFDKITRLTGISTKDVQNAAPFADALQELTEWIGQETTRIYSWSSSDLNQLDRECFYKGIPFPINMARWVDLQAVFPRMMCLPSSCEQMSLRTAAIQNGVEFDTGAAHRAAYDAEKTAQLLVPLLDGSYRRSAQRNRSVLCTSVSRTGCSLDAASGGQLSQLLQRLKSGEQEALAR